MPSASILSWALAAALALHAGAHVALLIALARAHPRYRAAMALLMPPLAPYYGYMAGRRRLTAAWLVGLVAYAAGVALANV